MGPGEIPVNLLTHLNIAFGYINQDYQITNMDGLTPDVYKVVGDLKARNPNLKIMIALGGWAFSDPGTWQSVFPTAVSSESNRATFIKNLLGFLSQYGYDGVDFDWEYPGADDRGGSASDGENYTQLLKELRAAIDASGKNYTVTFTAPTSYWYLRHFDLKAMTTYVDWVNLMAYDLHGVWDGNNPIGNQVLAHTNLTDIDLALDLFWRVNVEPSAIVLGLGFYGRSFSLTDTSCWKPGCKFNGPGKAGRCTGTPGILSYREIKEIQENTGGGSYLDKEAAVRYLVYSNNNWISFDDESTFRTKIEYANRMGLSGLMVWAIDLDDNYLHALRAVSNSSLLDNGRSNFDLVDLKYLFPPDQMPPAGTVPTYGLTTFGGPANSGEMDPSESGFGFLLFAGDSFAVSRLRKREGEPEPFVFIDCPVDVDTAPKDKTLTARVICLTDDLIGCFRVMERGVEGTIVEMPDNCAPNRFARAISLNESSDQDVPSHIRKRDPSSQVFDFKFDFDLKKMRRDTNNTSIRMDYSNVAGYWKQMVDSPGVQRQSKPSRDLVDRFWADQAITWRDRYERYYGPDFSYFPDDALKIKENISAPIFWHSVDQCPVDEADSSEEGFGAFVTGTVDAQFYFGMSLVARVTGFDSFDVTEANGFITIDGTADLTYGIGGAGVIDITKANKGNPAISHSDSRKLKGTAINAGYDGSVTFDPYFEVTYQMATFNGTEEVNDYFDAAAPFDGLLSTRVLSDLGNMTAYFPFPNHDQIAGDVERRDSNKISTGTNNVLYSSTGDGGKIALGTFFRFGMNMEFLLAGDMLRFTSELADVQLVYDNLIEFSFYPGDKNPTTNACTDYNVTTNIYQNIRKGKAIGWGDDEMVQLTTDRQSPDSGQVCYPAEKGNTNNKRDLSSEAGEETSFTNTMTAPLSPSDDSIGNKLLVVRQSGLDQSIDPSMIFGMSVPTWMMESEIAKFTCSDCLDCKPGHKYGSGSDSDPDSCCGCACMDCIWGYDDIPNCVSCQNDLDPGQWPWGHDSRRKRDISEPGDSDPEEAEDLHQSQARVFGKATTSFKKVTVCGEVDWAAGQGSYPAFPKDSRYPWDGIEGGRWDSISKYWGNSSADCASWQVTDLKPADEVDLPGGSRARAVYQTEHVFEGQLIGDFFSMWLHRGHIKNQDPMPPNPRPKMDCAITHNYVMDVDQNWVIDGEATTFLQLLLHELGSKGHLDRLTVMMGRPNGMKGSMFTGNEPISLTKYRTMSADEQLQAVKQMGMVFNYLNTPEVWDKFCATYEAIYDLLGDFNTWYATNGGTAQIPNLQNEWRNYIRTVLDSMASRTRTTFDILYNNRWMTSNDKFVIAWTINRFINRQQIRLSGTCPHLGH